MEVAGADVSTPTELETATEALRAVLRLLGRAGGSADAADALLRHWVRTGCAAAGAISTPRPSD